jgi:hypothetical protein
MPKFLKEVKMQAFLNIIKILVLIFSINIVVVYPFICLFYLFDMIGQIQIFFIFDQYFNLIDAIAAQTILSISLLSIIDAIVRLLIINSSKEVFCENK